MEDVEAEGWVFPPAGVGVLLASSLVADGLRERVSRRRTLRKCAKLISLSEPIAAVLTTPYALDQSWGKRQDGSWTEQDKTSGDEALKNPGGSREDKSGSMLCRRPIPEERKSLYAFRLRGRDERTCILRHARHARGDDNLPQIEWVCWSR